MVKVDQKNQLKIQARSSVARVEKVSVRFTLGGNADAGTTWMTHHSPHH